MSYIDQLTAAVKVEAARLGVDATRLVGNRLWARVPGHSELRKARAIIIATLDERWTAHGLPFHPKVGSWAHVFGVSEHSIRDAMKQGRHSIAAGDVTVDRALTIAEIRVVADRLIVACGVSLQQYRARSDNDGINRDARCLEARKFAARSLRFEWKCLGLPQRPSIPQIATAMGLGIANVVGYIGSSERAQEAAA